MDVIDREFHGGVASRELLVLAFHKIGAPPAGSSNTWFYIPTPVFEEYLKWLRDSSWRVIDADTFVAGLTHPEILPLRSALLTFDDGYRSMCNTAVPLLSVYGFRSVLFVPTSFVGGTNCFDEGIEPEEPICDWDDLLEIQRCGVSLQSHGVTHRHLSELDLDELRHELRTSKSALETRTGQSVTLFSFPYGDGGSSLEIAATELCQAGYRAAFLYGGGRERIPPKSCYRLSRVAVGADTDLMAIVGDSKCSGLR
jgi:peptidoglycan/xylan/chitin deacetylase (PgdA/CDA1 family)